MRMQRLGRTGLSVSAIALGTVEIGVNYGIAMPGEFGRPSEEASVRLLVAAADAGINLFDTAPAYGESERLLGRALAGRPECRIATKVSLPRTGDARAAIETSLRNSCAALRRDVLDIVQIHNATTDVLRRGEVAATLDAARARGQVRCLGASVYTVDEALAVIADGRFDMLQVAFNLLDQRMAERVFPAARRAGVGILVRSAFLKGVLTEKARHLPTELAPLRNAAENVKNAMADSWDALPEVALRFCLSTPDVGSVLVGARTRAELDQALNAESQGPLPADILEMARGLAMKDERLLNPSTWPVA